MFKGIVGFIVMSQLILFGTVDRIQKAIEKKEYDKAVDLIIKGLEKEPYNAGISYYQSKILFDPAFKHYNIDSARVIIDVAIRKFDNSNESMLEELIEDGVTEEKIRKLSDQIRDKIFIKTLDSLSIQSARRFQQLYPASIYDEILIYKIDSMEFQIAEKIGSKHAFISFIEQNPASVFKPKADSILDHLRFMDLEEKKNLINYYDFLKKYPLTRFRNEVEAYILKVATASGSEHDLRSFINFSQVESLKKKVADVLYYQIESTNFSFHPNSDSVRQIAKYTFSKLFPVVENERIGFYDESGELRISPAYTDIPYPYKCELISDDWLMVWNQEQGRIITKGGLPLLDKISDYKTIGKDVGIIGIGEEKWLYHKSGFQILDYPIQNAEALESNWIKIKRNNKWGLVTVLGLEIAETRYDDVYKLGDFYVFEKNKKFAVYTRSNILNEIEERGLSLEFKFDDIELVNDHSLIGFRGERECFLDSSLNFLIPWGEYEIYPDESGWYLRSEKGYRLYNPSEADIMDQHYEYLESNDGWLAIKTNEDWMLLPRIKGLLPSRGYDSIKLVNENVALLLTNDSRELLFASGKKMKLSKEQVLTFPNRSDFIKLKSDKMMKLFTKEGEEVITNRYEEIKFLTDTLLKVQVRGKEGLINTKGEWILNPIFNSLDEKDGLVLTLLDGKIGCYDPTINELINAEYELRLTRINQNYLAKKQGKYGVIDFDENTIISFDYDEINSWNDSTFLVKRDQKYWIIDQAENLLSEKMESVIKLIENDNQAIYRFIQNGKYGLISNNNGLLLKPEFTDIFNIGTQGNPLFFADQHLDKAGYHVVSYINQFGKLVLSRAYTKDEFEMILCDD